MDRALHTVAATTVEFRLPSFRMVALPVATQTRQHSTVMLVLDFQCEPLAGDDKIGLIFGFGRLGVAIEYQIGSRGLGGNVSQEIEATAKRLILAGDFLHLAGNDRGGALTIGNAGNPHLAPQLGDVTGVEFDVRLDGFTTTGVCRLIGEGQAFGKLPCRGQCPGLRQAGHCVPVLCGDVNRGVVHWGSRRKLRCLR